MSDDEDQSKTIKELVSLSSNVGGSVTGAFVGFVLGGPPGALVGAALGPIAGKAMRKVGTEIANRLLGPREKFRVGNVIYYAALKIDEKLAQNEKIRNDDFFKNNGERSTAEEIMEGVLLTAQREYEEKKLKLHANLLANLVFYSEIDRAQANMLIRLSERLSYRQLCLLSIFAHKENYSLRQGDYRNKPQDINAEVAALLQEIYQMYSEAILNSSGSAMLGVGDVDPTKMKPQGIGVTLHNLMELYNMDEEDLNKVAKILK